MRAVSAVGKKTIRKVRKVDNGGSTKEDEVVLGVRRREPSNRRGHAINEVLLGKKQSEKLEKLTMEDLPKMMR